MIGIVFRVGIDLTFGLQFETGLGGQLDDQGFGQIAGFFHRLQRCPGLGAMIGHTQGATGFEHVEKGAEIGIGIAIGHPVMRIAEGQHHVGRPRSAEHRLGRVKHR